MLFQKCLSFKYFIITTLLSCVVFTSYSQNQTFTIKGVVKDFEGLPITAVTVKVQHSTNGTFTYTNGEFTLEGVKVGDSVVFTSVSWQRAYFVVERKYDVLNFRLLRDTLITAIRDNKNASLFLTSSKKYEYSKLYEKNTFDESIIPVAEIQEYDKSKMFISVEVSASFSFAYPKFIDSLENEINQLNSKFQPKKKEDIFVYLWIRGDRKIEVNTIKGNISDEVKAIFKKRFESIVNISPAIQNGRNVGVLSVAKFQFDVAPDKTMKLKMIDL